MLGIHCYKNRLDCEDTFMSWYEIKVKRMFANLEDFVCYGDGPDYMSNLVFTKVYFPKDDEVL